MAGLLLFCVCIFGMFPVYGGPSSVWCTFMMLRSSFQPDIVDERITFLDRIIWLWLSFVNVYVIWNN